MTPRELAEEVNRSPKTVREFLRKEFPRPEHEKKTLWVLNEAQIQAVKAHFA